MVSGIPIGSNGERSLSDMQPELNPITEKEMLTLFNIDYMGQQ